MTISGVWMEEGVDVFSPERLTEKYSARLIIPLFNCIHHKILIRTSSFTHLTQCPKLLVRNSHREPLNTDRTEVHYHKVSNERCIHYTGFAWLT
ncbi:hypothetical protein [Vibrio scophthalmi]|uniref:hypothetical protein n=1 Tax=Vibrio scophthalmi TaxID=45658 RepID=UPI0002FE19CB|nr:hypothetical protein [Vibrio scophthalmi]